MGRLYTFSPRELEEGLDGTWLQDGMLKLRDGDVSLTFNVA